MESTSVSDLDGYLKQVSSLPHTDSRFVYRGQRNSDWRLHSAAHRRIISTYGPGYDLRSDDFADTFLDYHQTLLLASARNHGFDEHAGLRLADLPLLAKLQHFGAATGLLDFTSSPLVALWFACEDNRFDGSVFVVESTPLSNLNPANAAADDNAYKVVLDEAIRSSEALEWEPGVIGDAAARVIAQQSVLLIDRPAGLEDLVHATLTIPAADKQRLRTSLISLGFTQHSLFMDFFGFANNNATNTRMTYPSDQSFAIGLRFHESALAGPPHRRRLRFRQALTKYNEHLARRHDDAKAYFQRGNIHAETGEFASAIADYDTAISQYQGQLQDIRHLVHYNRANAKVQCLQLESAITDYDQALRFVPSHEDSLYNRGSTYAMQEEYARAIEDFDRLPTDPDALFNKANSLVMLGELEKAMSCYRELADCDPSDTDSSNNRDQLVGLLENLDGRPVRIGSSPENNVPRASRSRYLRAVHIVADMEGQKLGINNRFMMLQRNRQHRGNAGFETRSGRTFGDPKDIGLFVRGERGPD